MYPNIFHISKIEDITNRKVTAVVFQQKETQTLSFARFNMIRRLDFPIDRPTEHDQGPGIENYRPYTTGIFHLLVYEKYFLRR